MASIGVREPPQGHLQPWPWRTRYRPSPGTGSWLECTSLQALSVGLRLEPPWRKDRRPWSKPSVWDEASPSHAALQYGRNKQLESLLSGPVSRQAQDGHRRLWKGRMAGVFPDPEGVFARSLGDHQTKGSPFRDRHSQAVTESAVYLNTDTTQGCAGLDSVEPAESIEVRRSTHARREGQQGRGSYGVGSSKTSS